MVIQMRNVVTSVLPELRRHPVDKRVRPPSARRSWLTVDHAILVWEPRRVVPSYAVPVSDVTGQLVPQRRPTWWHIGCIYAPSESANTRKVDQ